MMSEIQANMASPTQGQEHQPRHAAPVQSGEAYQPRHAAPQMDDEFLESQARAADQYRYDQMYKQLTAEYAIERIHLLSGPSTEENKHFATSQYQLIVESLERQEAAKQYAKGLRSQIYYVPEDGVWYEGRHRKEEALGALLTTPPAEDEEAKGQPEVASRQPSRPPPPVSTAGLEVPPKKEPKGLDTTLEEETVQPPPAPERRGLRDRLTGAWYAGWAAVSAYFMHPEKGRRRRNVAQAVTVLGMYATAATAAWLTGHGPDGHDGQAVVPPVPEPGPQPYTEPFFDTLQPQHYQGETYEWGAMANQVGSPNATPELLEMVQDARGNGLLVDTWGDPAHGFWGINDVTVKLADGTYKPYCDTPHKLAILQWYAARDG